MNPAHRDGWPPPPPVSAPANAHQSNEQGQVQGPRPMSSFGSSTPAQLQQQQQASQPGQSSLPPPPGPFFAPNQQVGHNLPTLAGLSQQASPRQSNPLPGINQATQQQHNPIQSGFEREREHGIHGRPQDDMQGGREREVQIKEEQDALRQRDQQREREIRERQQLEQAPSHQNHAGSIHLHQPVAVGPRTIHGPNGLLANPAAIPGPSPHSAPLGAPSGPGNIFGGAPIQQNASQPGQSMQPGLMVPFNGQPGVQAANMGQGQQPILNDALSYLDQVKVQFVDHPDVYNRFLDIMKDFKSGAIDTPGVIERVSTLFAGNPNLIQGFNTFLPPGYRIECGTGDDPNAIRVTTPMGTTVSSMPAVPRPSSNPRSTAGNVNGASGSERPYYDSLQRGAGDGWPQQQGAGASQAVFSPSGRPLQPLFGLQATQAQNQQAASPMTAHREQQAAAIVHQQEQQGVSQLAAATGEALSRQGLAQMSPPGGPAAALSGQGMDGMGAVGPQGAAGMEKRGPVEFNHAINYVNKIKTRFQSQPDIYKQFLEILQTYQRESKPIQDVYGQVTALFKGASDLLEDFKQFLPESAAQAKLAAEARQAEQEAAMLNNVREPMYPQAHQPYHTPRSEQQPRLPPVGNFAPTPTNKDNKRKRGERQGTAASNSAVGLPSIDSSMRSTAGVGQSGSVNKRSKQSHVGKQPVQPDVPLVSPTLTPARPEPLQPTSKNEIPEELSWFDRVRKHIGNKNMMNEFLKLCNLYSQDLIDVALLYQRAQSYIGGNPELMTWFKNFLGYDGRDRIIENRPRPVNSRVALSNCRGLGPSYRLLPQRERMKVCSGRDELCHSVLNDQWASHPTWASEDSGFIAHRKSVHEEGLHRIEEERHDYDSNIEACNRTIQLLDPLAQQLLRMDKNNRSSLTFPPDLGGQSHSIYQRVIMKIYGREQGRLIIQTLQDNPSVVIPVLLNRLKSRLDDWKTAQREWEKVWRDQTQKMFWKSLDHQSISVKMADKRQFQTKTLQSEIHVKYEEQKRQRLIPLANVPKYQLAHEFNDVDVVYDASHLVLAYAETSHATDFPRLTVFIKEFIPLFFGFDPEKFQQRITSKFGDVLARENTDEGMPDVEDVFSARTHKANGKKPDLLRGVLERGRNGKPITKDKEDSVASGSRGSTPDISSAVDDDMHSGAYSPSGNDTEPETTAVERWFEHPGGGNLFQGRKIAPNEPYKRDSFNLYGNLPIFCFFRMFVILYERLLNLKRSEKEVHETVRRAKANKPAIVLAIVDKLPQDFFGDTSPNANYYHQTLRMFEEFIKGENDMNHIEETLRRYYLQTGWQLYSFDKMLSALVRFGIAVLGTDGKDKTWEILQLFKRDRARAETTHEDELNYRKQVEKYAKDGDIYKITYNKPQSRAYIQIFKRGEPTFDNDELTEEARWAYYISSWQIVDPTEGVPTPHKSFYKRNIPKEANELPDKDNDDTDPNAHDGEARLDSVKSSENLEMKISVQQYKLLFTRKTEEWLYQSQRTRSGGRDGLTEAETASEQASGTFLESYVMNTPSMKDLSKDEVERINGDYRTLQDQGVQDTAATTQGDKEMVDA
ncbi:hypothetical protein BJ546DRAFT_130508 [Cryomyces antarcticus]